MDCNDNYSFIPDLNTSPSQISSEDQENDNLSTFTNIDNSSCFLQSLPCNSPEQFTQFQPVQQTVSEHEQQGEESHRQQEHQDVTSGLVKQYELENIADEATFYSVDTPWQTKTTKDASTAPRDEYLSAVSSAFSESILSKSVHLQIIHY